MKKRYGWLSNEEGFASLIGLLIVLIIVGWLAIKLFEKYYGKNSPVSPSHSSVSHYIPEEEAGPSAPPRGTIVDDVRSRLRSAQNKMGQRAQGYDENQ